MFKEFLNQRRLWRELREFYLANLPPPARSSAQPPLGRQRTAAAAGERLQGINVLPDGRTFIAFGRKEKKSWLCLLIQRHSV